MLDYEHHMVDLRDPGDLFCSDPQPWPEVVIVAGLRPAASLDLNRYLERNPIWEELTGGLIGESRDVSCAATELWRGEGTG